MITLSTIVLAVASVGSDYQSAIIAQGQLPGCSAANPYYRLIEGRVPEGLALYPIGDLRGRPKHAGEYSLVVEASNGCTRALVPVKLSVRARPILAAFETEVSLSAANPKTEVRIYADRPSLAYTVETSAPWLKAKPLLGRTPAHGEALAADLLAIEVDWEALNETAAGLDQAKAEVQLSCFRCRGTTITVTAGLLPNP